MFIYLLVRCQMFNLYWNLVGGTFAMEGMPKEEMDDMTTMTRI